MRGLIIVFISLLFNGCSQGGREAREQRERLNKLVELEASFETTRKELAPSVPRVLTNQVVIQKRIQQFARRPHEAMAKSSNYAVTVFYGLTPNVTAFLFFNEDQRLQDFELGGQ